MKNYRKRTKWIELEVLKPLISFNFTVILHFSEQLDFSLYFHHFILLFIWTKKRRKVVLRFSSCGYTVILKVLMGKTALRFYEEKIACAFTVKQRFLPPSTNCKNKIVELNVWKLKMAQNLIESWIGRIDSFESDWKSTWKVGFSWHL